MNRHIPAGSHAHHIFECAAEMMNTGKSSLIRNLRQRIFAFQNFALGMVDPYIRQIFMNGNPQLFLEQMRQVAGRYAGMLTDFMIVQSRITEMLLHEVYAFFNNRPALVALFSFAGWLV